jgi:hypothetical protein
MYELFPLRLVQQKRVIYAKIKEFYFLLYTRTIQSLPREKREYLGKCDNLNFKEKSHYLKR